MSADGKYITLGSIGKITISNDYGINWIQVGWSGEWYSVSMSSDGKYQTSTFNGYREGRFANGSDIRNQISTDYGNTWKPSDFSGSVAFSTVYMSSDAKLQSGVLDGRVYYSRHDENINILKPGSSGISGSSGVSGAFFGSSGSSGANGINGSSGSSGANGLSGSSGSSGANGLSGSSGLSIEQRKIISNFSSNYDIDFQSGEIFVDNSTSLTAGSWSYTISNPVLDKVIMLIIPPIDFATIALPLSVDILKGSFANYKNYVYIHCIDSMTPTYVSTINHKII
jgi:hypothetical protein